jgi:hypothetical protein
LTFCLIHSRAWALVNSILVPVTLNVTLTVTLNVTLNVSKFVTLCGAEKNLFEIMDELLSIIIKFN